MTSEDHDVSLRSDRVRLAAKGRLRRALIPLGILTLFVIPTTAQAACRGARATPKTLAQARSATLCLVNVQRRLHGLHNLRQNPRLRRAASAYSREMVAQNFFDHVSPDGSTLQQRLQRVGYGTWVQIGENIAWGSGSLASPARIVDNWMNSPGHRANILNANFHEIGVGVARGAPAPGVGHNAAVYTTDFGRAG